MLVAGGALGHAAAGRGRRARAARRLRGAERAAGWWAGPAHAAAAAAAEKKTKVKAVGGVEAVAVDEEDEEDERPLFVSLQERMRQSIEEGTNMLDWKEITPQWKEEKMCASSPARRDPRRAGARPAPPAAGIARD